MTAKWKRCKVEEVPIMCIWSHGPHDDLMKSDAYLRIKNTCTKWEDQDVVVGMCIDNGWLGFCPNDVLVWVYLGEE